MAELESAIGYKVMEIKDGMLVSLADDNFNIPANIGTTIEFPGQGSYLSPNKEFVLQYYSGLTDNDEALVTLEFDPADIKSGSMDDLESEISVSKAKIIDIEVIKNASTKLAVPLDPHEWENLHSPQMREIVPKGREVIVYHGTSSKKLANMMQHGSIDPTMAAENKTYEDDSPGVFVTKQPTGFGGAELYANIAAQHKEMGDGSDRVILELVIPLDWIQNDPDDTRYDEKGNINQYGANQGIVTRPIEMSRIRSVMFQGDKIGQAVPGASNDMFEKDKSEWLPIGTMMQRIKDRVHGLPEEYSVMVQNSQGLSRQEPKIDVEDKIAEGLTMLHNTFFDPSRAGVRESALAFAFKNSPYAPAMETVHKFFTELGEDIEYFTDNVGHSSYAPKPGENLSSYLRRINR